MMLKLKDSVCAVSIVHIKILSDLHEQDLTWNYVDASIWSAAEPSIGVVSASLPSLRPLFARLIWGRKYQPRHLPHASDRSLTTSWRSGNKDAGIYDGGSFDQLRETDGGVGGRPWVHNVAVTGGKIGVEGSEEYRLGSGDSGSHYEVPDKGIRVRTTVTVTERVDWQDDLF